MSHLTTLNGVMMSEHDNQAKASEGVGATDRFKIRLRSVWPLMCLLVMMLMIQISSLSGPSELVVDDTGQRLDAAVMRLMMADELAVDDEGEKAADNLENVLAAFAGKESANMPKATQDLVSSAVMIRSHLANADRKAAVEESVRFRKLADDMDAAAYRGEANTLKKSSSWISLFSILLTITCAVLLWANGGSASRDVITLRDELNSAAAELSEVSGKFEDERRRTTELQQRLLEVGRASKNLDVSLGESAKKAAEFESQMRDLHGALSRAEAGWNESKSKLDMKNRELSELIAQSAANQEKLKDIESERNRSSKVIEQLTDERSGIDIALSAAQTELAALRAKTTRINEIETNHAILEWSNSKLKSQNDEFASEIARLKDEMLSEAKRFRDQLAALRS